MQFQQMDVTLKILGEGGAAFHPVPAIEVLEPLDRANLGAVNMAANDPVNPGLTRHVNHSLLKAGDVSDRRFCLEFQMRRDRPVAEAHAPPDPVELEIELKDPVIDTGADAFQCPVEINESVQLMPVHDEKPPSIRALVDHPFREPDSTQIESNEVLEEFVVVAEEIGHPGFLPVHAEDFLDDRVGVGVPEPAALQLPAVDDVAHQIQVTALGFVKKVEKQVRLGMAASQVNIGDPDGVVLHPDRGQRCVVRAPSLVLTSSFSKPEYPPSPKLCHAAADSTPGPIYGLLQRAVDPDRCS